MAFKVPEQYRDQAIGTPYRTRPGDQFGWFRIPYERKIGGSVVKWMLCALAVDGRLDPALGMAEYRWEHVSVHAAATIGRQLKLSTPTWAEMCFIKETFWDDTDCVIQYHPPRSNYVNVHEHVLHLWRPLDVVIPMPPTLAV